MFCKNCGKEVSDQAYVCPYCGVRLHSENGDAKKSGEEWSVITIVGFVLAFLFSIAGLVCSIIGYKECVNENKKGKGLATAGIAISAVFLAITVISIIAAVAAASCFVSAVNSIPTYY